MAGTAAERTGFLPFGLNQNGFSEAVLTDRHVHIGQFHRFYFAPRAVMGALKANGIDECYFSSTTACLYCRESDAVKSGAVKAETQPTARELEQAVAEEIREALEAAAVLGLRAHPLYWVVPETVRAGIDIGAVFRETAYCGFKIHPRAQRWNDADPEHRRLLRRIFGEADKRRLTILIHTGADEIDSPDRFEESIRTAPNAEIVLAHVKNPEIMTAMLNRYPHVNADLSCTPSETVTLMRRRFPKERLLFGTDFPASLVFTDAADSLPDIPDEKQLSRLYTDWHKKT